MSPCDGWALLFMLGLGKFSVLEAIAAPLTATTQNEIQYICSNARHSYVNHFELFANYV